jgi:hypothetical protein
VFPRQFFFFENSKVCGDFFFEISGAKKMIKEKEKIGFSDWLEI